MFRNLFQKYIQLLIFLTNSLVFFLYTYIDLNLNCNKEENIPSPLLCNPQHLKVNVERNRILSNLINCIIIYEGITDLNNLKDNLMFFFFPLAKTKNINIILNL